MLSQSPTSVTYECDYDGGDFHHCDEGGGADVGGEADDASDMQNMLPMMVTMVRTTVVIVTKCELHIPRLNVESRPKMLHDVLLGS